MGRESSAKPNYQILAYLTTEKERVIAGSPLALFSKSEEDLKTMTVDIAKGMKADVIRLSNGDYMVIKV
jgi:siroheme synthase